MTVSSMTVMLLPIIPTEHVGQVPVDESDDDGDGFVECELTNGVSWSNANTTPDGDADCNDDPLSGVTVYPGAVEACDGVFNNCLANNYDADSAPADELDGDGDGFVDCFNGQYIDDNGCLCSTVTLAVDGVCLLTVIASMSWSRLHPNG